MLTDYENGSAAHGLVKDWVAKCWPALVAVASKYRGRSSTAEDLAAEAVVVALSVAENVPETLASVRRPCAWLTGIMRNIGRQAIRKRRRRTELVARHSAEIRQDMVTVPNEDWRTAAALQAANTILSPRQLAIVRGILLNGMSDDELAQSLEVTKATVRWHRHQAIQALRPVLSQAAD